MQEIHQLNEALLELPSSDLILQNIRNNSSIYTNSMNSYNSDFSSVISSRYSSTPTSLQNELFLYIIDCKLNCMLEIYFNSSYYNNQLIFKSMLPRAGIRPFDI
jgi:hypothetical protein